jgi:cyanophycinase-like exopeptidase
LSKETLIQPGPIALFGSGETAPGGQKIFDFLFRLTPQSPRVSIIETPAGFEPNSSQVAGSISDFIQHRLQNYKPRIEIIPARKRNTPFSPDDPEISAPILESDLIFMGPGSPTYAVRQLTDSLAWEYLLARHRLGAGLAFSSATTLAVSAQTLPVYEIYKVGEDIHWKPGLDFFAQFGLSLVFIPHWNNQDGGAELDTSRCYMGISRFEDLTRLLPEDQVIVGIDENTGLIFDFQNSCLNVVGQGNVTILKTGEERIIPTGTGLELVELGDFELSGHRAGISDSSWDKAVAVKERIESAPVIPESIINLAEDREKARNEKDWERADQIRTEIEGQGWLIQDEPTGYSIEKKLE